MWRWVPLSYLGELILLLLFVFIAYYNVTHTFTDSQLNWNYNRQWNYTRHHYIIMNCLHDPCHACGTVHPVKKKVWCHLHHVYRYIKRLNLCQCELEHVQLAVLSNLIKSWCYLSPRSWWHLRVCCVRLLVRLLNQVYKPGECIAL